MSIVVVGSVALDDVFTDHGALENIPGGSALYFSAAASLFVPVSMVGVIGDDFPFNELDFLKKRGVRIDDLKIIKGGKTFRWGGKYETDMNKRTTTNLELNVFENFTPVLDEKSRKAEYVFLGNINPELQLDVIKQIENPKFIGADTIECYIQNSPGILKQVLEKVNIVIFNDEEARLLTGEFNLIKAAKALLKFGPEYVIVKKGEHGSIFTSDQGLFLIPAFPVENVIDPTGAGDSFAGGVMGHISKTGKTDSANIRKAITYGGVTASFTVEEFGPNRLKNITFQDIEKRMEEFRSMTNF